MRELPEGNSLGWMQAPPSWISSHTVRFIGVVRVVIQDGEGFILIKKGKPLFYYFKHGTIELKGNSARDYFNSHPIIEFSLCKYSPEEFALALKVCNIEDHEPGILKEPESSGPVSREQNPPPRPAEVPATRPVEDKRVPEQVTVSPGVHTVQESSVAPQPVVPDGLDVTIISQIINLNGIVAISVFNDSRTILTIGDADGEALVKIAGKMLKTAQKVTPLLTWGPFVHMTLQISEGNMIIAPYHDNYLCLLTTRTINIGHIRRILRDLSQKETSHQVS